MLSLGFQGIEILFMNHPKISKNCVSASSKRQHQSVIPQGGPPGAMKALTKIRKGIVGNFESEK
jgi:hypothetical protein